MDAIPLIVKLLVVGLGLVIAYHGYLGYRRNDSRPMFYFAVGFAFVSVGAVCESLFYDFVGMSLYNAGMLQSAIVVTGMSSILYSLFGQMQT
ncbi:DUF7521 family protein (plasmid) [Haloferacaceae archaeon DSL9]